MENIEIIENKIIRIHNVFPNSHYTKIMQLVNGISYQKKESSEYRCSYIRLQEEKYQKLYILLEKYLKYAEIAAALSNQLGETIILKGMTEIVKIEKGDFLKTHIDDYNMYQAVIHIDSPESEKGGELCINNHSISPQPNSMIIFPGKTPHSVKEYQGNTARISISLGFIKI